MLFFVATQSFWLFSLRRVLCGLCRTVSQSRRKVSSCFLCVVSCGGSAVPFLNRDAEFLAVFPASCPQWRLCCVVPCRDAEFCDVFFASCLVGALPYRFSIATQSFLPFFLRRVLGDCVSVWFRAATQSFELFSLRRVLWGLCRTVSQSRRRVSCRFPCVVSIAN